MCPHFFRLQDQGSPRQDQHLHQDSGPRRGAGVRGDGAERGRRAGQARDSLCRRPLLADPRLSHEKQHQLHPRLRSARPEPARTDDHAGMTTCLFTLKDKIMKGIAIDLKLLGDHTRSMWGMGHAVWDDIKILGHCSVSVCQYVCLCVHSGTISKFPRCPIPGILRVSLSR